MPYALSWFVIVTLLALWSLGAWALHAAAVWTVSSAGALSGATSAVKNITLPDWLAPWVPGELAEVMPALIVSLGSLVDSLLQAAPSLAGGLTVLGWVVWAFGGVLLLLLGAGLHLLIALSVRRRRAGSDTNTRPPIASS